MYRARFAIAILLVFASIGIGFLTLAIVTGSDAVSMHRDGVSYVKTAQRGWVRADDPQAPSLVDGNPEGYDWDLFTIPFELPWTAGQCGEDSGVEC